MSLPAIPCPVCNSRLPLEVWMAHSGARQALVTLAELHPGWRLAAVSLRYLALLAPPKRELSLDRVAAILAELSELIRPARVEWKGRVSAAPVEAWIGAMEQMIADPTIERPLKSHNYLRSVVSGLTNRAEARAERAQEDRLAGRTPSRPPLPAGEGPGVREGACLPVNVSPSPPTPLPEGEGRKTRSTKAAVEALAKAKSILTPAGRAGQP